MAIICYELSLEILGNALSGDIPRHNDVVSESGFVICDNEKNQTKRRAEKMHHAKNDRNEYQMNAHFSGFIFVRFRYVFRFGRRCD